MRRYNPNLPTDQYQQYLTSQHGKRIAQGDLKAAVCTDCHGVHNILPANMTNSQVFPNRIPETCGHCHSDQEYMKNYSLPTNQFDLYKKSVHGIGLFEKGDRMASTCNSCHGNHGANPPGISSISFVCGICHVTQRDMFSQSPHKNAFAEMGLPQCESCHGNHDVKATSRGMLGVDPNSLCVNCHDEDSKGYLIAKKMKQLEDSLLKQIEAADKILLRAEKAGVEVTDGQFYIKDAHDISIKAQNAIHFFSLEKFQEVIQPGHEISNNAMREGQKALKEVQNRRKALAIISIIIFIAAISLYFKIKLMESKQAHA